jgi:protein CpxP
MKKLIYGMVMVSVLSVGAYAMDCGPCMDKKDCPPEMCRTGEKMHTKRVESLTKKLGLSPEQKGSLEAILTEDAQAMKAEMEKMKSEMKARKEAQDAKIKAILTPEQAAKFDEIQKKNAEKMEKMKEKRMKKMENRKAHKGHEMK